MSVRAAPLNTAAADLGTAIAEVQPEAAALAEGNSFSTAAPENPLTRNVVVSIRASLNDLCLQKAKGTWSPTPEALKSIFQQANAPPPPPPALFLHNSFLTRSSRAHCYRRSSSRWRAARRPTAISSRLCFTI